MKTLIMNSEVIALRDRKAIENEIRLNLMDSKVRLGIQNAMVSVDEDRNVFINASLIDQWKAESTLETQEKISDLVEGYYPANVVVTFND